MKTPEDNPHFQAGKRARAHGEPCENRDGRLSPASRRAWREGWQWQDRWYQESGEAPADREKRWAEQWKKWEAIKEIVATS